MSGNYRITMLLSVDNRQVDLRQIPILFTISVSEDSIKVRRSEQLYTPDFADDESLELTMKPVEDKIVEVSYRIMKYVTEPTDKGDSLTYCVCLNEDGEECRVVNGVVGTISNGTELKAFRFSDSIFNNIFWCYEDVTFKEE